MVVPKLNKSTTRTVNGKFGSQKRYWIQLFETLVSPGYARDDMAIPVGMKKMKERIIVTSLELEKKLEIIIVKDSIPRL